MLLPACLYAGNVKSGDEPERHEKLDSVIVSVSRAGDKTPVTFTMVGKEELKKSNPVNSIPMALNLLPSVVTYNEGGTGLGNSAMTIRGSKGSQINVTLNGITLNDSESQEVFWVNIPSLQSLVSSVQVQRGLGTTANGPGAFGASINMNTSSVGDRPFATVDISGGSWNTFMTSTAMSTGLTKSGLYANVAYSRGYTDGYIRNAKVKSQSLFAVLGWLRENNSLRLTYLMGDQTSGITWDGIDLETYEKDRRYNESGKYYDEYGNAHFYHNSVDRYMQHHLQLNYTHGFTDNLTWTTTLNYTTGAGYDEYYKQGKNLADYGFNLTDESDIIYRKEMANNYLVANTDLKYSDTNKRITAGLNLSRYDGDHFGTVLWAAVPGDSFDYASLGQGNVKDNSWYYNLGVKKEASAFVRAEFDVKDILTLYGDFQFRRVSLDMTGHDDDAIDIGYENKWNFFNPRFGAKLFISDHQNVYASYAYGNREPGRSDIKENVKGELSAIKPEKMHDIEIGYEVAFDKFSGSANLYFMEYKDMLLETGKLSSSGYAIKENIDRGYRRGIELALAWTPMSYLRIDANATLSTNKIDNYISYVAVGDGDLGETKAIEYGKTDMLMSPSLTSMAKISLTPWKESVSSSLKTTTFSIDGKYVSKQYIDNTARDEMSIPSYFVANLSVSHVFDLKSGKLGLSAYVNNLLNNKYYAYGWRWEEYYKESDTLYSGIGIYPQATTNVMFKVSYSF